MWANQAQARMLPSALIGALHHSPPEGEQQIALLRGDKTVACQEDVVVVVDGGSDNEQVVDQAVTEVAGRQAKMASVPIGHTTTPCTRLVVLLCTTC